MTRRILLASLGTLSLIAGDKPNFTGTWKMNPAKSDFGKMPVPAKLERVVQHAEPRLTVQSVTSSPQGELKSVSLYTTEDKESVNTVRGSQVKSVASWVGPTLTIRSTRQVQNVEVVAVEHWSLSLDGKVLTVINKISTPGGTVEATTVLDRQ